MAAGGRKSLIRRHVEKLHPQLWGWESKDRKVMEERCTAFQLEIQQQQKEERHQKFKAEVQEERMKKKEAAVEACRNLARAEVPTTWTTPAVSPFSDLGATPAYMIEGEESLCRPQRLQLMAFRYCLCLAPVQRSPQRQARVWLWTLAAPTSAVIVVDMTTVMSEERDMAAPKTSSGPIMDSTIKEVGVVEKRDITTPAACSGVGMGLAQEDSVTKTLPQKPSVVPAGAPTYKLIPLERKSKQGHVYDQWHQDPRLFFLTAPSRMLHEARRLAMYEPGRCAATTIPHGTSQIERLESVELQHGRIYRLSAQWFKDSKVSDQVLLVELVSTYRPLFSAIYPTVYAQSLWKHCASTRQIMNMIWF